MTALAIAVALVGAVGVLNLLLTFGVIRRMRQDGTAGNAPAPPAPIAPAGTQVAAALESARIAVPGETLFGFFSPGCSFCEEQLPEFAGRAREHGRVVSVVFDPLGEGTNLISELTAVSRVVVETRPDGGLMQAFQAKGYPSYCVVRDGVIASVVGKASDLPRPGVAVPA
ncbi:hypothetical protein [Allorhizocola rhizosphaerae]|uniref:hypothetical protein n=1 Tax=Allorhizocola rhizosphaerae TaxID=1872709 RepID=UPI000E3CFAF5|nr:hypothetical protein [Allorhizocola rhizosphaerae]